MFDKKKVSNSSEVFKLKYLESKENEAIFSSYREIINYIMVAVNNKMPFIPFSEWTSILLTVHFLEQHTEEQQTMITTMTKEIMLLANTVGYTDMDNNGFLINHNKLNI